MTRHFDRRDFLRATGAAGIGLGLTGLGGSSLLAAVRAAGAPNAEKLGWRLGCQAWTFHRSTLFDAIEKTASLGLKYIETYVGQRLSEDHPAVEFRSNLPANLRTLVKKKAADSGVKLLSHCDVDGPPQELLQFCKDLGMEMLIAEPPKDALDAFEKLCKEYAIPLALTNHPKPALYSNPDTVLKACNGRSQWIGASGDIGHWVREGYNPSECMHKLEPRLLQFHFRDMNRYGGEAMDVPLGTGMCNIKEILARLHHKRIKPIFMLEYKDSYSLPQLAQSIKFFDNVAAEFVANG
jgi:sugar phosphate isomerase/epimerase